jgi:transcriptional regulator with XRE-family HTH domain
MDLKVWINSKGISQKQMAEELGISKSYLSELLSGKRNFSPKIAQRIEEFSKGEVSRMELLFPPEADIKNKSLFNSQYMIIERGSPLTPDMREKVLSGEFEKLTKTGIKYKF